MVKGIIENTHIISSKVTKFIWLLGYNNFSKMDMYFETEGVYALLLLKINSSRNCFSRSIHHI